MGRAAFGLPIKKLRVTEVMTKLQLLAR